MEHRATQHVPTEESYPVSLKYIDVSRSTDTTLDVMSKKLLTITRNLMEFVDCQIRGLVSTRFTVLSEKPPDGHYMVR